MAIASGFSFQRVRTSITTGVVAASFLFGGIIEEIPPFGAQLVAPATTHKSEPAPSFLHSTFLADEEFLKQGGTGIGSAHHRDGTQALQAVFKDTVPPPDLVVDEPERFRQLLTLAEQPQPDMSFLLESNLREDIQPELYRRIVHEALQPQIPPQSYLHFEPIDDAPVDADQFATTRHAVVEALQPQMPPASFLLESNQREDISPELYRRIVIEAEQPAVAPYSFLRASEDIQDVTLDIERKLVVQAARAELEPPASFLLSSNLIADVGPLQPELYRNIIHKAQPIGSAHIWLHDTVPPDDVAVVPVPEGKKLLAQAELPQVPPASFTRGGQLDFLYTVDHFAWYQDDNADVDLTTIIGTEDQVSTPVKIDTVNLDVSHHLRLHMANRGALSKLLLFQLEYQRNGSGGWFTVNTTSSFVRTIAGLPNENTAQVSQRLTSEQPTYSDGFFDDGDGAVFGNAQPTNSDREQVFSIAFRSVDVLAGDIFRFRLTNATFSPISNITAICKIQGEHETGPGIQFASAHHRDGVVALQPMLQGPILDEAKENVRYISITDAESPQPTPLSTLRGEQPPPDIFVEIQRHVIHTALPIRDDPPVSVLSHLAPPPGIQAELYRVIVHAALPITDRPPASWLPYTTVLDDVIFVPPVDKFTGRHIAPFWD